MRLVSACLTAGVIFTSISALAQPTQTVQTAKLLQKFENWQVFLHETPAEKVCFAATQPASMEPKTAKRDPVFFYLTTWAKDGIRNEISVKVGYPQKPDSTPMIIIGTEQFALYPKGDKAFLHDPAQERKLLDAMKKGTTLTVKGTSARGTVTTDQYSLAGLSAALTQLGTACP
jgi:hypothetical protein